MPATTWNQRTSRFSHSCSVGSILASAAAAPPLQDLQEGARLHLLEAQPRGRRLLGSDGPAAEAAQEEIQQALARGGIVEHVALKRGLRRFLREGLETAQRRLEAFEEERVDGGVAGGQLRGVQVPALVVGMPQGMAHVVEVQ